MKLHVWLNKHPVFGNGAPSVRAAMELHEPQINNDFCCEKATEHGSVEPMGRQIAALALMLIASPAAAQPDTLGVFGEWGAFQNAKPRNCYAIAEPHRGPRQRNWKAFASISYWPQNRVNGQVHFRLSRAKRPDSAVILKIDDRTFQLLAGAVDAWGPDPQGDAMIVAAMRSGVEMTIETRAANGALVRDQYWLRGAATAIDAAAVACARPARATAR